MKDTALSPDQLAIAERYGASLGEKMLVMAVEVGTNCGGRLWVLANAFGHGLTESLMQEQCVEIQRIFKQALAYSPLGIGEAMLADVECMDPIYSAAEVAMLGRYHTLVQQGPAR